MRARSALLLAWVAAASLSCPKEDRRDDERLLRKLEEARADSQGPPHPKEDPNARLAELAAQGERASGPRPLPAENPTVHAGTVALELAALSTSQSVGAGKVSLTTEGLFLELELLAQNVGERPVTLDLSFATLASADGELSLARDAQRAAGTRELKRAFPPGQPVKLVLFFDVSREALDAPLALVLPPAVGGERESRIPLQ